MRLNSTSADPMAVIRVPKTPRKAFDPTRPAGTLLQSQLQHLEWAVRPAAERRGKAFRVKPAKTEAEAAARIAKLNAKLHLQATAPRDVMPPIADAAAERPPSATSKRSSKPSKRSSKPRPATKQKRNTPARSRRSAKRRTSR
jgi:hypothetical protein